MLFVVPRFPVTAGAIFPAGNSSDRTCELHLKIALAPGCWCGCGSFLVKETNKKMEHLRLVGGFKRSEKYELVSWDDCSQLNGKNQNHVPNHRPDDVWFSTSILV